MTVLRLRCPTCRALLKRCANSTCSEQATSTASLLPQVKAAAQQLVPLVRRVAQSVELQRRRTDPSLHHHFDNLAALRLLVAIRPDYEDSSVRMQLFWQRSDADLGETCGPWDEREVFNLRAHGGWDDDKDEVWPRLLALILGQFISEA